MREDLDKALVEKYPNLYRDRHGDMRSTCMVWGFPGDGWYSILDTLSAQLEKEIIKYKTKYPDNEHVPCAMQVKEKFGGLRFYMNCTTDEMEWYIQEAEEKAWRTCENCGVPGVARPTGWIRVMCDGCYLKCLADKMEQLITNRVILVSEVRNNKTREDFIIPVAKQEEYYAAFTRQMQHHIKGLTPFNYLSEKKHLKEKALDFFNYKVKLKFKLWWWRSLYWNKKRAVKKLIWKLKRKYGLDS